uniref:Uncharacterized protein n=1 Tax=Oryzias latipes TaxID=8090 RepID=A0A3P9JBQ1_ORYLA
SCVVTGGPLLWSCLYLLKTIQSTSNPKMSRMATGSSVETLHTKTTVRVFTIDRDHGDPFCFAHPGPVCSRATHSHPLLGHLRAPTHVCSGFWTVGGSLSAWRKTTHA